MYKACIIFVSDKVYTGEEEDYTGKNIANYLKENNFDISVYTILPEVRDIFNRFLVKCCDEYRVDLVLIVGSTELSTLGINEVSEESIITKMKDIPIKRRRNTGIINVDEGIEQNQIDVDILRDAVRSIQNSMKDII